MGDTVIVQSLSFSQLTATRVAGSYVYQVEGGGIRAGSTLRVSGTFDVVPKAV